MFAGNNLCAILICFAPGVNIYGANLTGQSAPYNVVQVVRNFHTPMNHAYNVTIEQQLNNKTAFSIAYVGHGRDETWSIGGI